VDVELQALGAMLFVTVVMAFRPAWAATAHHFLLLTAYVSSCLLACSTVSWSTFLQGTTAAAVAQ
jgi:hypothetical protein